jgi:hypothetical protein
MKIIAADNFFINNKIDIGDMMAIKNDYSIFIETKG